MDNGRQPYTVLGRVIGAASGWDMQDTCVIILYDFFPEEGVKLPAGDVTLDFFEGTYELYDDAGKSVAKGDIIEALRYYDAHA